MADSHINREIRRRVLLNTTGVHQYTESIIATFLSFYLCALSDLGNSECDTLFSSQTQNRPLQ